MDGMLSTLLLTALSQLLFRWFGVALGIVTAAGLSLVALYFVSSQFRYAYNLFMGPSGRQARYGYRKGESGLQVTRSGYAFDEDEGRWRYVQGKPYTPRNSGQKYSRSYTRYQRGEG